MVSFVSYDFKEGSLLFMDDDDSGAVRVYRFTPGVNLNDPPVLVEAFSATVPESWSVSTSDVVASMGEAIEYDGSEDAAIESFKTAWEEIKGNEEEEDEDEDEEDEEDDED